jgi:hypothetical protein
MTDRKPRAPAYREYCAECLWRSYETCTHPDRVANNGTGRAEVNGRRPEMLLRNAATGLIVHCSGYQARKAARKPGAV